MAVNFLKKGSEAKKALAQEEAKAEEKKKGTFYRFYLPAGKESQVTFLDGNLDEDGMLDIPMFYEHNLFQNGNWRNWYVCTADKEPCPICEGGDNPYLAGAMTVIDHSEYESKGKTYKNQVRLFIAKRNTIRQLQKIATKRGGLAGCTFDVARVGDKAPAVGDMYEFVEKSPILAIKKKFKVEGPINYAEVLHYRTADELRELGLGLGKPVGYKSEQSDKEMPNYEDKL